MKDYYAIIGVSPTASQDEIKRAYRKLAVRYHPDKNPDPVAQQRFVEINEAYDVVGDPQKRVAYDQRLTNPWADVLTAPEPPKHRDPAYRRKRPPVNPSRKKVSDTHELMKHYLPYVKWTCWVGLAVMLLFLVDYVLPYKVKEEKIIDMWSVRSRRGGYMYHMALTESRNRIKLYGDEPGSVHEGDVIRAEYTRVFSRPMWIGDVSGTNRLRLAYLYRGGLALFPFTLLVTSLLGVIFRKRIEFCFNVSIVTGIMLLIFWYLV